MRVQLDPENLRRELARRGLNQAAFATIAGLTEPTVSHGMTGKTISEATLSKMARGLAITPVIAGADDLLAARLRRRVPPCGRPHRPDLATVLASDDNIPAQESGAEGAQPSTPRREGSTSAVRT